MGSMEATMEKLKILADSAKYDASCSSSGVGRHNDGRIGNSHASGICHSWSADGRCISLLKILFTNKCVYDCEYCVNRRSNDFPRASFEPDELARLTIEFYRRNYIEGLFLSSAVERSPDYTAERILSSLELLRGRYGFAGYIHAKIIPGVSSELVHRIGLVADRLSVNIELPTAKSLELLAPQKKPHEIFAPMRQITNSLIERNALVGPGTMFKGQDVNAPENYLGKSSGLGKINGLGKSSAAAMSTTVMSAAAMSGTAAMNGTAVEARQLAAKTKDGISLRAKEEIKLNAPSTPASCTEKQDMSSAEAAETVAHVPAKRGRRRDKSFAPAGQTTQMIIGAGGESDRSILTTSENLYRTFKMKRVYYSAYIPVVSSSVLPALSTPPPLRREHRIYQADWLLRFYGFSVKELLGCEENLDPYLDPKVTWAIRNLERFPVEVNSASYDMLMRVPGIGAVSAKRIVRQRRFSAVRFEDLKKMGVVLKRAKYFVTCLGRYCGERRFEPEVIRNCVLQAEEGLQMSMFDAAHSYPERSPG